MPELLLPEMKPLLGAVIVFAALALAACGATTGTTAGQPMPVARTPEQIKGDCWMKYEGDAKMNLDKRVQLVDQCIAERSKGGVPVN